MKPIALILALAAFVATTANAATTGTVKPASTTTKSTATTAPKPATTSTAARSAPAPRAEPAPAPRAHASESQMHLGLRAIGGSLGYISPENVDGTFTLGIFADMGRITDNITLEPRIDYWNKSEEQFGAKASVRDIIIGARGKYRFQTANPKLMPFAGAGLSFHMIHAEASVTQPGFPEMKVEDSTTKLGLDIGGGVATPVGPRYDLIGEAWYGIVSDVSQFSLRVGMSYHLGN